jgi:hypothetical protein
MNLPLSSPQLRRSHAKSRVLGTGSGQSSLLRKYEQSLANPFDYLPPLVQAGTVFPLNRRTIFSRSVKTITVATGNTSIVFYSMPCTSATINFIASGGTPSNTFLPCYNATAFNSSVQTARCISGGVSVLARFAQSVMPPTVYSGMVFDSSSNFNGTSFTTLVDTASSKQVRCGTNEIGAYSAYRPQDMTAFSLNNAYGVTNGSTMAIPINWVGFALDPTATYNFEYNVLYHMETNAGLDVGTGDDDESPAEESLQGSVEDIARTSIAVTQSPYGPLSDITHAIVEELVDRNSRRASSFSLRGEGGLVGSSSTPPRAIEDYVLTPPSFQSVRCSLHS